MSSNAADTVVSGMEKKIRDGKMPFVHECNVALFEFSEQTVLFVQLSIP
jgi:hypothetical protein